MTNGSPATRDRRWNHNIEYHPIVLRAVPRDARRVLDVGCGEGMLARALAERGARVTGIDLHEPSIARAREQAAPGGTGDAGALEFVCGDAMTYPFEARSFDAVVSVATLHHLGLEAGLRRMAELVRPGGVVAAIGLARSEVPRDLARDAAAMAWSRLRGIGRERWSPRSPVLWPPDETYRDADRIARRVLPGCEYRRHVLWRYSVVWTKPR